MAKNPLLPEPWEATLSYVKQSNLDQGGEGLFTKQKRPKQTRLYRLLNLLEDLDAFLHFGLHDYECPGKTRNQGFI